MLSDFISLLIFLIVYFCVMGLVFSVVIYKGIKNITGGKDASAKGKKQKSH